MLPIALAVTTRWPSPENAALSTLWEWPSSFAISFVSASQLCGPDRGVVLITDLIQIRRLGEQKREENGRLRKHMKRGKFNDVKFRRIAIGVEENIDCTACANCCRVATTRLMERDIEKLARYFRIRPAEFIRDYTTLSEDEELILKRNQNGCVFLSGNLCSI